ncbi:unnamed protein product [Alopecurus aequalis]
MDALANLPGDVLVAILVRLPARSIARCRQVCRAWRSVISEPSFDIAHAERPAAVVKVTTDWKYDCRIVHGTAEELTISTRTNVVFNFFRGRWHRDNVHINPPLTWALTLPSTRSWVHGSWDGVVCIKLCFWTGELSLIPPPPPTYVDQYVLWNPLTAACAIVSPPGNGGEIIGAYSHPSTRRFHLVHASGKTVGGDHLMAPTTFRVLRVGDAVWREIPLKEDNSTYESKISMDGHHARCVRLHGNLHWLVLWSSAEPMKLRLLVLDTAREKFRLMEAPPTRQQGPANDLTNARLGVLSGGKLCAFIVEPSTSSMQVWVLDDYEAVPLSSWRLKERISLVSRDKYDLSRRFCMDMDVEVVEGVREGEEIFLHRNGIMGSSRIDAYNLGCKEWNTVNVCQSARTVLHRESILQHEVSFGGASRTLSRKEKVDKNGHRCYYL